MRRLTKKEKAAIEYFGLDCVESEYEDGVLLVISNTPSSYYPGRDYELLDSAVSWYDERLADAREFFSMRFPNEKQVSDRFILAISDLVDQKRKLLDVIIEAENTASDILDGFIAPSRIGKLRNKLRSAKIWASELGI